MQYESRELKSALGTSEDARLSLEGKIQHLHKEKSCLEGHIEDVQKQVHLINVVVHRVRKKTSKPHNCSAFRFIYLKFNQLLEGMTQYEQSERRQQELQKELKDQKVVSPDNILLVS